MKKRKPQRTAARPQRRKSAKTAAPQTAGYLFKAIPSHFQIRATMAETTEPAMIFPGRLVFSKPLSESLERRAKTLWHTSERDIEAVKADWIVNTLADADHYPHALGFLKESYANKGVPIFNHPDAVVKTRRHSMPHFLSGIDNLIVPKCERFRPTNPNHFLQAFEELGFTLPVLIRPVGSHTGTDLVLIEKSTDWQKIYGMPWGGQEIYMTQWTDFQSADGEWRKLRLSITPHSVRLRHILYGDGWLVHAAKRDAEKVERELEILLHDDKWDTLQKLGRDIRDRLGMDFVGADIGWKSDTEFVLFEANASMSILSQANMPEHRRDDYLASWKRIEADVKKALSDFIQGAQERTAT